MRTLFPTWIRSPPLMANAITLLLRTREAWRRSAEARAQTHRSLGLRRPGEPGKEVLSGLVGATKLRPMRPPPSVHQAAPEWARVQILLNLGRTIEAADEAKAIAQDTSWDRRTGLRCGLP